MENQSSGVGQVHPDEPAAPAGWYPDPTAGGVQRWWDGHKWGPLQAEQPNPYAPPNPHTQGPARKSLNIAVWLTVFWPGAGHFYLGLKKKGMPFFVVYAVVFVVSSFVFGVGILFVFIAWLVLVILTMVSIPGDTVKVNEVLANGQQVYEG